MASSFNPEEQNSKIESRIVVALERISQAFRVLLWDESKENSLSPIQTQILIFLLFHSQEKCKVSYLANEFNMTKATISDSVKILLEKKLIKKCEDKIDTRSYSVVLTKEGKVAAQKASAFANVLEKPITSFSPEQKEVLLNGLLKLIFELNRADIISTQRMCFSCSKYKLENGNHYCSLLQRSLAEKEIKIDCPEHEVSA